MKKITTIALAMSALLFVSVNASAQSSRRMERRDQATQNNQYDQRNNSYNQNEQYGQRNEGYGRDYDQNQSSRYERRDERYDERYNDRRPRFSVSFNSRRGYERYHDDNRGRSCGSNQRGRY